MSPRIKGGGSAKDFPGGGEGGASGGFSSVPKLKIESAIAAAGSHEFSQDPDG